MKTRDLCAVALMTALLCIAAPLAIPVGEVPVTLATFAVYLAAALLGCRKGTMAVLVYLLLGLIGLPVFSGGRAGLQVLTGVTGGFLVGYLPCAAIIGWAADRQGSGKALLPAAMVVGTAACYMMGTLWFMKINPSPILRVLEICVLPFLAFDALKIVAAAALAAVLRQRIPYLRTGA